MTAVGNFLGEVIDLIFWILSSSIIVGKILFVIFLIIITFLIIWIIYEWISDWRKKKKFKENDEDEEK